MSVQLPVAKVFFSREQLYHDVSLPGFVRSDDFHVDHRMRILTRTTRSSSYTYLVEHVQVNIHIKGRRNNIFDAQNVNCLETLLIATAAFR